MDSTIMSERRKKAAIIGFGGMGQRHFTAYESIGVDVVAVSDLEPAKVKTLLPSFDTDHIYSSYQDLIEHEADNIDMDMSFPVGVSNVICSDSAEVIVKDGILIAIITRSGE